MADPQASARIFISYRREDSSGHVLALLPALRREFGNRIFKDTDNISDYKLGVTKDLTWTVVLPKAGGSPEPAAPAPRSPK